MRSSKTRFGLSAVLLFALSLNAFGQSAGKGFDVSNLDRSVEACTDFNLFANGGWLAKNQVPPAYSSWGSFNIIDERNRDLLHQILEDAAKNTSAPPASNAGKIGAFYASCMDEARIESEDSAPLEPSLRAIAAVRDVRGLMTEAARLHDSGGRVLFAFNSARDEKKNTQVIGGLPQGGVGGPHPDHYIKHEAKSK